MRLLARILLCALAIVCAVPRCAVAQPKNATHADGASGGSVLRQVSGIEGNVPVSDVPEELIIPQPDTWTHPGGEEVDGDIRHWLSPHEVGTAHPESGFGSFLPWESVWPSFRGPRTPQRYRHQGLGEPLVGTSWNNRPQSAGWLAGIVDGAPLSAGEIDQGVGFFGGIRFGWDYDYYWGLETRLAGAAVPIIDLNRRTVPRTADLVVWDLDLLYYPWGDSRWRPYFMLGLGVSVSQYYDLEYERVRQGMFAMPFGGGLKYRCNDHLVARIDLIDNLAFGAGEVDTLNNLTFTFGVEVRYGGRRKLYWPWYPGRHIW